MKTRLKSSRIVCAVLVCTLFILSVFVFVNNSHADSYGYQVLNLTDDQFWDSIGNMADGIWSGLTSVFSGIFANTVMRNIAIYLPLLIFILGLIVYFLFLGGGKDD